MKVHVESPEPYVFLRLAQRAMFEYRQKSRRYTASWADLDLAYAAEPFHLDDPDVRPPEGSTWRPRGSKYEYLISLSGDGFVMEAIDSGGAVTWRMTDDMAEPARIE